MSDLDTVFDDDWPDDHRSGVVAVVGRPNVGKSTLVNAILGQKVAIVTPKPQTTRTRQLGIYSEEHGQMLFVDTPGLHKPQHKLGQYMVNVTESALKDADVILWILDASEKPQRGDQYIADTLKHFGNNRPIVLALNKIDLVSEAVSDELTLLIPHETAFRISALEGIGITALLQDLLARLPHGPRYYPADQITEVNMRFVAAEVIREKVIENTEKEIPYSVAVTIDDYKERDDHMTYVSATIYVERDSQKGIIIGKGGNMIKRVGREARQELESMLDTKVFVELHVKTLKNWRSNIKLMKQLGYSIPKEDAR